MPFVTQEHRDAPNPEIAGDRCFVFYQHMMKCWKESPRWTTIDALASGMFPDPLKRAEFLAFLVFMAFHGYDYESEKMGENGDIEG